MKNSKKIEKNGKVKTSKKAEISGKGGCLALKRAFLFLKKIVLK